MKLFLIITTILTTFLGCSHNNAFDRFSMSHERELSEENIQSSKIVDNANAVGVVTAVYLNRVYPDLYKGAEYFYIYLNVEGDAEKTVFELNGSPSLLVEELQTKNSFTSLTLINAEWKHYYLVGFKAEKGRLNLNIKNEESSSVLIFKK